VLLFEEDDEFVFVPPAYGTNAPLLFGDIVEAALFELKFVGKLKSFGAASGYF